MSHRIRFCWTDVSIACVRICVRSAVRPCPVFRSYKRVAMFICLMRATTTTPKSKTTPRTQNNRVGQFVTIFLCLYIPHISQKSYFPSPPLGIRTKHTTHRAWLPSEFMFSLVYVCIYLFFRGRSHYTYMNMYIVYIHIILSTIFLSLYSLYI